MTEFETATLAYQASALGLQELAIWAQVGVGILHAALIGFGLWMMHRASRDRNTAMDDARVQADKRHEEAMTALRALIARTGGPGPSSPPSAA